MKPFSLLFAALTLPGIAAAQTKVTHAPFGKTPSGSPVEVYTLADSSLSVRIISFGAHIISIQAPDRAGKVADVVLGYNTLDGYLADNKTYMGSVPGRYANRIAKGTFALDGHTYHLPLNDKGNTLHGGLVGFDRLVWNGSIVDNGVELTVVSPDGDQGFPGKLTAHVRYTLVGSKLRIDYSATTDKPTVVNLTNHTYFNLAGSGNILNHVLTIDADRLTPVDATLIPTGNLTPVSGTPFDFRKSMRIGARIQAANEQLKFAGGYDHNFVLNHPGDLTHPKVVLSDPSSGRTLMVYTSQPGVQFYSGNFLDGSFKGRSGTIYSKYAGLCLETQHYPDSPNHPAFPTTTLLPGSTYRTTTIFEFGTTK
ncbi:MAG: aldose epimerase family protein [Granulicella sp.]